jgi:hypothetical protein
LWGWRGNNWSISSYRGAVEVATTIGVEVCVRVGVDVAVLVGIGDTVEVAVAVLVGAMVGVLVLTITGIVEVDARVFGTTVFDGTGVDTLVLVGVLIVGTTVIPGVTAIGVGVFLPAHLALALSSDLTVRTKTPERTLILLPVRV